MKQSLTLKVECLFTFFESACERLLGPTNGTYVLQEEDGSFTVTRPEIFKSDCECSPKNNAYVKVSQKYRVNKVGAVHSSAALLENAQGDDSVRSVKAGVKMTRVSAGGSPASNFVAIGSSAEVVKGANVDLAKGKMYAKVSKTIGGDALVGSMTLRGGLIK